MQRADTARQDPGRVDDMAGRQHFARFGAALRRRREQEGMSLRRLAALAAYSPGWLSKVENGLARPTVQLAEVCDRVLGAGGELTALARAMLSGVIWAFPPAQLPPCDAHTLVGRTGELEALDAALERAEAADAPFLAAVDGPPGVGKTALVLHWAHRVRDRFPGGVLYADLAGHAPGAEPADPARVLAGFLLGFGVPATTLPRDAAQLAAVFRSLIADRRVLVVLDDAAGSSQVRALLPATPGTAVVVTGRRRLAGVGSPLGRGRLHLRPLPPAGSLALLRSVAGAARVRTEPAAARVVADACGHLPLALCVAAERVAAGPHRRLGPLAAELTDPALRLDALTDAEDPRRSVRAAFDASYARLDTETARAFRLLGGGSRGDVPVGDAARLLSRPVSRARRLLEVLADEHLAVETGPDRYRVEGLLRLYAAERAQTHGDTHRATA
ncbi:XRE family transcriptional regulator [Streptomyces sp. RFCAC02]|uniref:XRE family transcriptional regulator n=1 Tax=Streptomyces sp. RFCAC02 TaxID=2499143 RepID=UPI00101F8447|nr:XRE family transcriptional regulator [Streptomyces sp. RFCAC02]